MPHVSKYHGGMPADQLSPRMTTQESLTAPQVTLNEGSLEPEEIFSNQNNVKTLQGLKSLSFSLPLTYFNMRRREGKERRKKYRKPEHLSNMIR